MRQKILFYIGINNRSFIVYTLYLFKIILKKALFQYFCLRCNCCLWFSSFHLCNSEKKKLFLECELCGMRISTVIKSLYKIKSWKKFSVYFKLIVSWIYEMKMHLIWLLRRQNAWSSNLKKIFRILFPRLQFCAQNRIEKLLFFFHTVAVLKMTIEPIWQSKNQCARVIKIFWQLYYLINWWFCLK